VSGLLGCVRVRRNFKAREEAAAEKAALEIKAQQIDSGDQSVLTHLTENQVQEAEAVFQRLAGKIHPLAFYVDYALANYREPEAQMLLKAAVADYLAARERDVRQDQLSARQLANIKWELKRLMGHFQGVTIAELTVPMLVAYLEIGAIAAKSYNNRRGVLSTLFKFAFHRGWIAENPIPKIPVQRMRRKRGMANTLSPRQARELMTKMETYEGGRWVTYFALCLFAGIRPSVKDGEITRLRSEDISLDAGIILVSAEVSKVREQRKVVIQPNLAAWLRKYPLRKPGFEMGNVVKRRGKIAKEFKLSHDVCRHSYISYFVAKFRSIGEAAIQAGNSEAIIRRHYLDLKSRAEADEFFNILPKQSSGTMAFPATVNGDKTMADIVVEKDERLALPVAK
jgi:integrase